MTRSLAETATVDLLWSSHAVSAVDFTLSAIQRIQKQNQLAIIMGSTTVWAGIPVKLMLYIDKKQPGRTNGNCCEGIGQYRHIPVALLW